MQYIPTISEDILASAFQSLKEQEDEDANVFMIIKEENPLILQLASFVINSDSLSEEFKDGYCKGISSLYTLISSQLESESMEESIKL